MHRFATSAAPAAWLRWLIFGVVRPASWLGWIHRVLISRRVHVISAECLGDIAKFGPRSGGRPRSPAACPRLLGTSSPRFSVHALNKDLATFGDFDFYFLHVERDRDEAAETAAEHAEPIAEASDSAPDICSSRARTTLAALTFLGAVAPCRACSDHRRITSSMRHESIRPNLPKQ